MVFTPDPRIRVAILGPVLVAGRDGVLVEPSGALGQRLIRSLVLARNHALSTEALIDDLWADEPPSNAKAALHTLVSRLRGAVTDGLLLSTASGYALSTDADETDVGLARALQTQAAALVADPRAALALVDEALALWRGDADDHSPVPRQLRTSLARARIELRSTLGEHEAALADIDALLAIDPLDEHLVLSRMTSLAALDRRNEALRQFADFRELVGEQLGSSPSRALVSLNTALLRADDPDSSNGSDATHTAVSTNSAHSASPAPPAPSAGTPLRRRIGLRLAPNALIGRDADLASVEELLSRSRLVTILGPGGLGKTRLAQELAQRSNAAAVIVVELASVGSDDDVTLALATTLGIRERSAGQRLSDVPMGDLRSRILAQLAEHETLLVIDNCEHVIDGAARWVADILASAATVRAVATSRSPLAIGAEHVYPLGSLASNSTATTTTATPNATATDATDANGPAVQLFIDRATAARPGAALPVDTIARLCTKLDGLPLAIELAAARIRSMSVDEIERRLQNRFTLLTTGDRSAPERHRTLQAVIDWSWNFLSSSEQSALRRLSRFADGFGSDAAEFLVPGQEIVDLLDALTSQSLLGVSEHAETGRLRYRMLETVREFGVIELEKSGETTVVQESMFRWAEAFCLESYPQLDGPDQLARYRLITLEHDNLLAIMRLAVNAGRPDVVVSVFAVLAQFWTMRGNHSEVATFGPLILTATTRYRPDAAHADVAAASLISIATIFSILNDRNAARALSGIRTLVRSGAVLSPRLGAIAGFLLVPGGITGALTQLEAIRRSPDDSVALVGHLVVSQLAENDGDFELANEAGRMAWAIASARGDVWAASMAASMVGQLASQQNLPTESLLWSERAEIGLRALNAEDDLYQLEWMRGANLVSLGRLEEARVVFDGFMNSAVSHSQAGDIRSIGLAGQAELARADGQLDDAAQLYLEAVATFAGSRERGSPWFLLATAALIAAWITDETGDPAQIARHARVLRTRVLALKRARPEMVDKPVLGTAALGYALWVLTLDEHRDVGLELLAVAEGLRSRQDQPVLHLDIHLAAAEEIVGAEALAAARAKVAALSLAERANRAHELFALRLNTESLDSEKHSQLI
ncbi:BTAD domain-containing putative transcriptional regulator [Leifsonia kafniensis]|uniref:BTAD domain-containing putative transcriptional regulator n=1 Tax=Leifsonia kafniensis TaxID=475957 RepID=A0ABP7KJD7_9MICO